MAKRSSGKMWDEDLAKLVWCRRLQRVSTRKILLELGSSNNHTGKTDKGRTHYSVNTLVSDIRNGKSTFFSHIREEIPNVDAIPQEFQRSNSYDEGKRKSKAARQFAYSSEQREFVWRARKELGMHWSEIAERYNQVFGENRTSSGLSVLCCNLGKLGFSPGNPGLSAME